MTNNTAKLGDTVRIRKKQAFHAPSTGDNSLLVAVLTGRLHESVIEEYDVITLSTQDMVDEYNEATHDK